MSLDLLDKTRRINQLLNESQKKLILRLFAGCYHRLF